MNHGFFNRWFLHIAASLFVLLLAGMSLWRLWITIPTAPLHSASLHLHILPPKPGEWRFIVSGDSRNCGDVVMPTIAAHSSRYTPSFYWHLGD